MCVAVPMKIQTRNSDLGVAEIGGVCREISLVMLPEAQVGDYVIVHAGFAIERLDEDEALRTLDLFRELGEIMDIEEPCDE